MNFPYAIQIVGPAGGESFLNSNGQRTTFEEREQFPTRAACTAAMDKGFDIFRQHGFLVRVVNTEEPTEECDCEPCLLGEMACAY